MSLVEAALAFALVMIIFSTMVSAIMEILYRLISSREKLFVLTMERLFDQTIWPLVRQRLSAQEEARAVFIKAITTNPADEIDAKRRGILDFGAPKGITELSVMEFIERLASTEIGKAISEEGEKRVIAIVNDLSQKFSRFCKGASQRLTEQSLGYSLWVSFVLAFALNIDAVSIFHFYLTNQNAREQIIAQEDKIKESATTARNLLEDARRNAKSGSADANGELEQVNKRVAELQKEVEKLKTDGLPIGYDMYPGCTSHTKDKPFRDARCAGSMEEEGTGLIERIYSNAGRDRFGFAFWVLSVLLGGLLVGLGAPFWFDVASGLSRSLQLMKALKGTTEKKASETEGDQPAPASGGSAPPPRTPVEAFTTAIAALPVGSAGRAQVAPDGTIGGN